MSTVSLTVQAVDPSPPPAGQLKMFARGGNMFVIDENGVVSGLTVHPMGGAEHTPDTLANLNTKVSDATLDDVTSSRPPSGAAGGDLAGTYPNPTVIGRLPRATFAVSTNTAALGAANVYACTDTSAARTLTVSTATIAEGTPTSPRVITITDDSGGAGTNNITIVTEGAETIDGAASALITVGFGTINLISDGTSLTSIGSSGVTNAVDRVPKTINPLDNVDVYSESDLPPAIIAPDGVLRVPLEAGVKYTIHNTFVWPRLLLPIGESISNTEIAGDRFLVVIMLLLGDDTPHIWGRNVGLVIFKNITIIDISNSGVGRGTVLFDITGGLGTALLAFDGMAILGVLSLGNVLDVVTSVLSPAAFEDVGGGMTMGFTGTFKHSGFPLLGPNFSFGLDTTPALKPMWSFLGPAAGTGVHLSTGSFSMKAGDPGFYIDQTFIGSLSLIGMGYGGVQRGDFFRVDVSLGITGEVAADKSISSFAADVRAISSVAPAASGVTFNAGVRHNWRVGDTVTHTGFATAGYNGVVTITSLTPFTYSVTAVPFVIDDAGTATHDLSTLVTFAGQGMYRGQTVLLGGATPGAYAGLRVIQAVEDDEDGFTIPVVFSVGGTGTIQITRVTTASDHPMVRGETHTISGTAAYNGTRRILNLPADNQFDIPIAWVSNEGAVGTVTSSTLDETNLNINAVGNGAQKDSASIGSVVASGNAVSTVITMINTWTDLDLGTLALAGTNIERWGSVNSTTGEVTYIGIAEFSGELRASMSVTSSGGSQGFQFRAVVNGSPLSDGVVVSVDLSSSPMISVTLLSPIQCVTGDTVRVQVQNTSGTSNVLIQDLSEIIS